MHRSVATCRSLQAGRARSGGAVAATAGRGADPAGRAVEAVRREVRGPDGESATRIRVQTNQGRRTQSVNCKQPVCNGVVRPGPLALTP